MRNLTLQEKKVGVIFGFLNQLLTYCDKAKASKVIFCFDSKASKRRDIYPQYKENRTKKEYTEEEYKDRILAYSQFDELRVTVLPEMGFENIFCVDGYESDDLFAGIIKQNRNKEFVIISTDNDLYQLINDKVSMFDFKTLLTQRWFVENYRFKPQLWWFVKAVAGCTSDNVKGLKGIGEKTVCKYLNNELPANSPKFKEIEKNRDLINFNEKLVKLPFDEGLSFEITEDNITKKKLINVFDDYKFRSFLDPDKFNKWMNVLNVKQS